MASYIEVHVSGSRVQKGATTASLAVSAGLSSTALLFLGLPTGHFMVFCPGACSSEVLACVNALEIAGGRHPEMITKLNGAYY